jgi:ATP synthase protein I
MPESDKEETNRKTGIAYAAGISLFVSVMAFCALGWMLDRWLGTAPWFLVAGVIAGAIIGFIQFIRLSSKTY